MRPPPTAPGRLRSVLAGAALLVLVCGAGTAWAGALEELVARYRSVSGRHDDAGYEVQREALEQIADLKSEPARKTLKTLHGEEKDRDGDVRRAVLVLGAIVRQGGPAEIDYVIKAAEASRSPVVLESLARVFAGAKRADARAYLRDEAILRASSPLRAQMARAFGAMGDKEAALPLLIAMRDEDIRVRTEALFALGELKEESAWHEMALFLKAPDARVREVAARALGVLGAKAAAPHLVRALADPASLVVESAANALALLETAAAIEPLIDRLAEGKGENLRVADALVRALERLTGRSLGDDPELWRAWWKEAKDKPGAAGAPPSPPTTVSGPRYYGFGVRSNRVLFVLDVSRSMGWNGRLEVAQNELVQALGRLPAKTKFDIVTYSDFAQAWAGKLGLATAENVRRAQRFVERLEPVNATNTYDGIKKAFEDEEVDTVFFLSDGTPTAGPVVDQDEILTAVREMNRWRRIRIHTIALVRGEPPPFAGTSENATAASAFMRRLAEQNDGQFREVK